MRWLGREPKDSFRITYKWHSFVIPMRGSRDHILDGMARTGGFYERDLLDVLRKTVGGDEGYAIDVGANIGNHTLFISSIIGLKTYAFEPVAENRLILERLVSLNGMSGKVVVLPYACGANESVVRLEAALPENPGTFRVVEEVSGEPVRMVKLDQFAPSNIGDPQRLRLMKIDVEGFEAEVLRGARKLIEASRPTIAAEITSVALYDDCLDILSPLGYSAISVHCATPTVVFDVCPDATESEGVRTRICDFEASNDRLISLC